MAATSRPRTPGGQSPSQTQPSQQEPLPTENGKNNLSVENAPRRSSLGFLRRSKSTEPVGERKLSSKLSKKMKEQLREEERRLRESIPKHAPRLPDLAPTPKLKTFGGDDTNDVAGSEDNHDGRARSLQHNIRPPPIPIDPYARTESMTHRGRYSYASSAVSTINSPRRLRRRKDPTPYNLLVVGARNSGKTSFLNFLRKSLALPPHKPPMRSPDEVAEENVSPANSNFTSHYVETEIDGERVGLTLWDSEGLEKNVVDLQLPDITAFVESKFEETFAEEMKVVRSPGVRDTHIHCVFLILDPARLDMNLAAAKKAEENNLSSIHGSQSKVIGILDNDLDLQVLRVLQGKTTVVPVISKADTVTTAHMAFLKKAVWESLKLAKIDPLEVLTLEEQEDDDSSGITDDRLDEADEEEEENFSQKEATDVESQPDEDGDSNQEAESAAEQPAPSSPPSKRRSTNATGNSTTENPFIPLSILSPDPDTLESEDGPVGRQFPWGFADPYNPEHCDFVKLKDCVFKEWRSELREASREICYERWRTNRLNNKNKLKASQKPPTSARYGPTPPRSGRATR